MSLPSSEPLPSEGKNLPPARLRRRKRLLVPSQMDEKAAFITELAHYVTPSIDFFIFSFLSGLVIGFACYLDSPAFFFLASIIAPFMAPVIGISLASVFGSKQFFLRSLAGIVIGACLVFLGSALIGLAALLQPAAEFSRAMYLTHFSWQNFLVLGAGSILTVILLVRSPLQKPLVSSTAIAYGLYLPLGISGFSLIGRIPGLWPDGLIVFLVHLAVAILLGTAAFAAAGLRPKTSFGYTLGSTIILISIISAAAISGLGTAVSTDLGIPTSGPTKTPQPTARPSVTFSPHPLKPTPSPTNTLIPTQTRTIEAAPLATPIWAKIDASGTDGAVIRESPAFASVIIKSLLNGSLVEILPETAESQGHTWIHVKMPEGLDGWVIRTVLITATASPPD